MAKQRNKSNETNGKKHATQQSVDSAIWSVCVLRDRRFSGAGVRTHETGAGAQGAGEGRAYLGGPGGVSEEQELLGTREGKPDLSDRAGEPDAAKLATREDSERSWTIDLSARKAKAAIDARPFKETARVKTQEADGIKDRLGILKKAKPRDEAAIAAAETEWSTIIKQAREAANKAEQIENAVFDLKAVNPNRKADVDIRTPGELLDLIEAKGHDVAEAIAALRAMK